jgi:hypothetical protein
MIAAACSPAAGTVLIPLVFLAGALQARVDARTAAQNR